MGQVSYLFSCALKNGVWGEALPTSTGKHKIKKNRALVQPRIFVTYEHEFQMREDSVGEPWKETPPSPAVFGPSLSR